MFFLKSAKLGGKKKHNFSAFCNRYSDLACTKLAVYGEIVSCNPPQYNMPHKVTLQTKYIKYRWKPFKPLDFLLETSLGFYRHCSPDFWQLKRPSMSILSGTN
jgi:hypothetical protein